MEIADGSAASLQAVSKTSLEKTKNAVLEEDREAVVSSHKYMSEHEQHEETLVERLNLLRYSNPFRDLDERAFVVRKNIDEKAKNAPKTVLDEAEENKPEIEKRLEQNDKELSDLLVFGNEIMTNIKVANEKRELLRREFETQQRVDLENGISKQTTEAMARYNDIVARWSELGAIEEPLILFQKMQSQSDSVIELLRSKDDMIDKCQREIDRIDANFEDQLLSQQTEVCTLVERVNAQIDLMKNAYRHRLNLLEDTLDNERQTIALKEQEKWKQFYQTAQTNELFKLEMTREKKLFYTNEIQRITAQQEEITRSTRIRLEKDSETLLYDLRCTKNQMLMNSEKLDYNYQVLQKRNEENVIINNQQKRRVGKLNEALVATKKRIKSANTNADNTLNKLTNDIQKLHDSITDLEKKNESFHIHNRKKFVSVWDVNFQEMKSLIERVFDIDRILHEQQLGLSWQKPELSLEEFELIKYEKALLFGDSQSLESGCSSGNSKVMVAGSSLSKSEQFFRKHQRETLIRKAEEAQKRQEQRIEKRLLRNILCKISTRGGFLVEDRLLAFLEPYTEERKTLVRIDNIFAALRITDMAAVNKLVECFKPYAWCPNCMDGIPREQLKKLYHPCSLSKIETPEKDNVFSQSDDDESDEESTGSNETLISKSKPLILPTTANPTVAPKTCENHFMIVESAMVLTALSEFTNQQAQSLEEDSRRHYTLRPSKAISGYNSPNFSLIEINDKVVCEYWRKFLDYMSEEKLKLWQSLEHGLLHYLNVLKQRERLDKECTALRQQNAELKHLLQKFKV